MRTSLFFVILAGLAVMGLNLTLVRQKIGCLKSELAAQTMARQMAETDLASTREKLAAATAALVTAKSALETATSEKQEALAKVAAQAKRMESVSGDFAKARVDRDTAQAELARYRGAGLKPEEIVAAAGQIKQLAASLAAAQQTNSILVGQLKRDRALEDSPVLLPYGFTTTVIGSDPKWRFIVLDAGDSRGVLKNAEVLVSRQGKLVARARVSRVEKDRCVADLMPGWELGEVLVGDAVIPAFPRS